VAEKSQGCAELRRNQGVFANARSTDKEAEKSDHVGFEDGRKIVRSA